VQYYPTLRYFEVVGRELIFTTGNALPLARYNIHDEGGIIDARIIDRFCEENITDIEHSNSQNWTLPFAYLFGRSDFTTTLYGANIYPEHVRAAIEHPDLRKIVSGKFSMSTENDRSQNQYLLINVELANGLKPSSRTRRLVQSILVHTLLERSSEYRDVTRAVGRAARPVVRFFTKGDIRHFGPGIKQRWIQSRRH
jgi:phenylacetate-CoA ligase